jgi:SsrA-binding protein
MKEDKDSKIKIVATNRKAKRDYHILEAHEAGIELRGNEVKSLRTKGCSLDESFARIERGEVFLYNMHIPEFEKSSYFKPDPRRIRKLLLHKKEIERFIGFTTQRGFTIIPLKVYFNEGGIAKVEIALAKGKLLYDKRKKIKEEIVERETQRALKKFYRKH